MAGYNKKSIFIAGCMGMLIFGVVIAVLGSVLPSLIMKFEIELADAGSFFISMSLGMMGGSLVFGPLADNYGYKGVLVSGTLLVFAGIEGIALAPSVGILWASLFLVGFGGGAVNGGTNALVSDISGENRGKGLSLLGVFFGIGALGVPFLLGTMLDRFTYDYLIGFLGALMLIPLFYFSFLKYPLPKQHQGLKLKEGISLASQPALLLFGLILFVQSGLEMTVSGWSATFMSEELGVNPNRSVLFLSFYWVGLIIARLTISWILQKFPMERIMTSSIIISVAGAVILILSTSIWSAIIALVVTGLGFAAIFPLVFAYVGTLYHKYSGTAFSVILTIALFGGMSIPWSAGIIAQGFSIRTAMLLVPVLLVCSLLLFRAALRKARSSGSNNKNL